MSAKRKLIIVAGAGSSLEFGMPSVEDVHKILLKSAAQNYSLASDPAKNLYGYLSEEVERYLSSNMTLKLYKKPNFEDILYLSYALAGIYSAASPLGAFIGIRRFPEVIEVGQSKPVDAHMLRTSVNIW